MPKKSRKSGINGLKLPADSHEQEALDLKPSDLSAYFGHDSISVSLKYFQKSCECFSDWQPRELKKFTGTLEKIRDYEEARLKGNKALCDIHKGDPKRARFRRPEDLSPDIRFYEIKVDPSNKARIHGFFASGVFFLVWLDRRHECFPP